METMSKMSKVFVTPIKTRSNDNEKFVLRLFDIGLSLIGANTARVDME